MGSSSIDDLAFPVRREPFGQQLWPGLEEEGLKRKLRILQAQGLIFTDWSDLRQLDLAVQGRFDKQYQMSDIKTDVQKLVQLGLFQALGSNERPVYVLTQQGRGVIKHLCRLAAADPKVWGEFTRRSSSPNVKPDMDFGVQQVPMQQRPQHVQPTAMHG